MTNTSIWDLIKKWFCCWSETVNQTRVDTDIDRNAFVNPHGVYSARSDVHEPVRPTITIQQPRTLDWHNQQSGFQNNLLGATRNPISTAEYSGIQSFEHIQPKTAEIEASKRDLTNTSKEPAVARNCSSAALVLSKTHCGQSSSVLQQTAVKQFKLEQPEPIQIEVVKKSITTTDIVKQHEKPFYQTAGLNEVDRKKVFENPTTKTKEGNSSQNENNLQSLCFQPLNKNFVPPPLRMISLPEYPVPARVFEFTSDSDISADFNEWLENGSLVRKNEESYINFFRMMIYLEEANEQINTSKCDFQNLKIHHGNDKDFYFESQAGMEFMRKSIENDDLDRFILVAKSTKVQLKGRIKNKNSDKIFIEIINDKQWNKDEFYDLKLQVNRNNYQLHHFVLDFMQKHKLFKHLIDHPMYQQIETPMRRLITSQNNMDSDLNEEQRKVVCDILEGSHHPLPYLLYGPPGTGKTKTLVNAIKEIVKTTQMCVLLCSQSNAACDEIGARLTSFLTPDEMLRMYSISREIEDIDPKLKDYCNLFDGKLMHPSLEYIYKYRVVICTLSVSGCLSRARIDPTFSPQHFSYVIIDECASAHETMALTPIAGLCTEEELIYPRIILSGDPKQLDIVTKSMWANTLGYSKSWLEQLINLPLYKSGIIKNKANSIYITQLIYNYRSHPCILHIPNKLFYEGALKSARRNRDLNELGVNLPRINSKFPIIIKSVQGFQNKVEGDTSSFNIEEVNEVMEYVKKLLAPETNLTESEVGIISPYKLQCTKIKNACQNGGFERIQIGTSEVFQGQEKKVIILSTVVSRRGHPGDFVSNPQRMNVVLTRAQYLLIVVGDPHTLNKDSKWSQFIQYCWDNKGLIQSGRYFKNPYGNKKSVKSA